MNRHQLTRRPLVETTDRVLRLRKITTYLGSRPNKLEKRTYHLHFSFVTTLQQPLF